MEPLKVAKLADLHHSLRPFTATAFSHLPSTSSSPPPPPPGSNPHRVLPLRRFPTAIIGILSLPNHTAPSSFPCSCFQFSDDSASVCCDLLQFQPYALGKQIRVTAWNFVPFKCHGKSRGSFLEIIKWCFLDPNEEANQMDSIPLVPNRSCGSYGNNSKARYRVYGVVESVGPVSVVPCTMVASVSDSDLNSSSKVKMLGFVVQLMCCECRLCGSKELISDLESGSGHSFTKKETVYFCGGASPWHPAMTKLIGNRVMVSRLKKKLTFITKEDSWVMHVTVDVSVLHVCRVSKKWLPCLKSGMKMKGECGTYTGVIKGVYMQGMALELDHDVWLLLTDELHTLMHGLRVGAVVSVRNVHFVDPQFSWTKIVILGACIKTSIIVESFSPLETACNVVLKSQSMLGQFIQSLPFSARLWLLLLVSSLRKMFAGSLSDKEILGSKHEEGLVQMYASSLLPPSVFQSEHGSFIGIRKHDLNCCSGDLHCNILKLVIPASVFIHHCIDTLERTLKSENRCKLLPVGNHSRVLPHLARYSSRPGRKTIPGKDVGITLLGHLKINPLTTRLQLVDATGGIDVLIPDLPLTWNAEEIYEVTEYDIFVDGISGLGDRLELLEIESLSCRTIFNYIQPARERELSSSIFAYFHWNNAKCRKFPRYPCRDKKNESLVPKPGCYHLLRVSHKFPLQGKYSNIMKSDKSNTFVEAKVLPFDLLLSEKREILHSYNVSRDKTKEISDYLINGNNEEQVWSNKRQKLDKESACASKDDFFTSINELRACSNLLNISKENKRSFDLSSDDISCLANFRRLQHENVICTAVVRSKSSTKSFDSKSNARKVLLEFSLDSFFTYQSLKIGDCYIIEHCTKDCFCNMKDAGFGSRAKFRVGSGKLIFSISFISGKDSVSPSADVILTKEQIEGFLLRSNVDSPDVSSDVCLYLPVNLTDLLDVNIIESEYSEMHKYAVSEESANVSVGPGIVAGRTNLCCGSQNSNFVFPEGNLISLEGDVVDIHDIGSSLSNACSSAASLDSLQLKGLIQNRKSLCIHVLVHKHMVKIFGSISKHAYPIGFGPGVTATFHRILDARSENKFMLLPVSFIVIKSIKVHDKQCTDWSFNLSLLKDAYNPSPDSVSCLISQLHQCPSNKQIMLRCRVVAVFILVLERNTTAFDIPLAGFLLDDGSSSCCCWANAERAAALLRLHEEPTTSRNLGRILRNYQKITVKNQGLFIESPFQDLAVSVTSGNAIYQYDENNLKFMIFNACAGRVWNVVASLMDAEEVRQLDNEYLTETTNLRSLRNIWANEVSCPRMLAEAKNMLQELRRSSCL
ncbi:CST complex subunit CTC1 isoform X2 [Arachis stenosperma]|uniref:CST complex subunit CTC1 isoform X2 n=1 Tax=Arachis stenosperma TaxID=217475 RepID=UPI0025AB883B|nr:CST complex subunit CTC1 isoform X2 [Arachis stenosperma]